MVQLLGFCRTSRQDHEIMAYLGLKREEPWDTEPDCHPYARFVPGKESLFHE